MHWILAQVALGGALGAAGRYLTGVASVRLFGATFPAGTLSVNVIGSFVMGVAFVLLVAREGEASRWVPFVMTGLLGGYTTFSAFSLDLWTLFDRGCYVAATVYLGGSVFLSVVALVAGIALARGLVG
jgi:CrcB protein